MLKLKHYMIKEKVSVTAKITFNIVILLANKIRSIVSNVGRALVKEKVIKKLFQHIQSALPR